MALRSLSLRSRKRPGSLSSGDKAVLRSSKAELSSGTLQTNTFNNSRACLGRVARSALGETPEKKLVGRQEVSIPSPLLDSLHGILGGGEQGDKGPKERKRDRTERQRGGGEEELRKGKRGGGRGEEE